MKKWIILATMVGVWFLTGSCRLLNDSNESSVLESSIGAEVEVLISRGEIYSKTLSQSLLKDEIRQQILYLVPQLRSAGGIVDMSGLKISLNQVSEPNRENISKIMYSAKFPMKWIKKALWPRSQTMPLPSFGSSSGRRKFVESFASECVDQKSVGINAFNFWHFFNPAAKGCKVSDSGTDKWLLTKFDIQTQRPNTGHFKPRLENIWEDKVLSVVAMIDESGSSPGKKSSPVPAILTHLTGLYGEPSKSTIKKEEDQKWNEMPILEGLHSFSFDVPEKGQLELVILNSFQQTADGSRSVVKKQLRARMNDLLRKADLVFLEGILDLTYLGSTLLGASTSVLQSYKIVQLVGAGSFAFVENSLAKLSTPKRSKKDAAVTLDLVASVKQKGSSNHGGSLVGMIDGLIIGKKDFKSISSVFVGIRDSSFQQFED